ncbi:DUF475 domain-containing protein [Blattabacterium cuenoti]|uniref:DUF475 domain-containing protein n=1 Tax=Blattabacterium cuenoti TaxID=1653831 RepID=UPI00163B9E12|nr:DUF475 domain-containing protein [Blattabacterium cuenoti]
MDIEKYFIEIIKHPILSITVIGNLFLIESILSVDNAIMLASMITNLQENDRKKAIKYGIIGAYFFRGLCLIFVTLLIKIWWLKPLSGLYLIFTGLYHFFLKEKKILFNNSKKIKKKDSFWKVILIVEIMDLSFSIDNIFASVALSENFLLIFIGVFMGIFFMRLITKFFIRLMKKFPELKNSAFFIVIILGVKLIFSSFKNHFFISEGMFSLLTFSIFIFPLFFSLFNKIILKKLK